MKRWVSVAIVFLSIFSGCSNKKVSLNKLTIWESYNDEEHAVFMALVKDFMQKNPGITVSVQRIPFNGMEQKLLTALASHTNPDIARVDYAFVAKLSSRKAVIPIPDSIITLLKAHIQKPALYSNFVNGKFYGLPDQTTCIALFYNKDLFKKEKITSPPATWEDFVRIGKKLTDEHAGVYAFGMHNSLWWTFPFFNSFGAHFISDSANKCLLDSKEAVNALKFKVDLYRKYHIEAGAWQSGAINPEIGFRNGKYAMIFDGPWSIKSMQDAKLNFGVALIPAGPNGSATTVGGTDMVVLNKNKAPLAIKFLLFLLSKDNQAKWANSLGEIPLNRDAYSLVDSAKNPFMSIFIKQMETAVPRPPLPEYSEIEQVFNQEMELALLGKKSPKKALKDATEKVNETYLGQAK